MKQTTIEQKVKHVKVILLTEDEAKEAIIFWLLSRKKQKLPPGVADRITFGTITDNGTPLQENDDDEPEPDELYFVKILPNAEVAVPVYDDEDDKDDEDA